jgi:CheY-like chemotaxis protein
MDVVRADSGSEALKMLHSQRGFDAVVTDVMMPGMSGVEFLAVVRRSWPSLPALVITGYADFATADELPADVAVLRKPFRRKEFVARVQGLLSARQGRHAQL